MEAGLDVEPEGAERLTGRPAPVGDGDPHDDVVGLAEGDGEDRVELLRLLHEPDHLLGLVAEVLGCLGQVEEPAQRRRIEVADRGPQHPELEAVLHLVEAVLEVPDLGGEPGVAEHECRVGEADGGLGDVLHLDEDVDGAVEVGEAAVLGRRRWFPPWRRGQFAEPVDPGRGAPQEQDVAGRAERVAVDVGDPLPTPADGDDAHAGLDREARGPTAGAGRGGCSPGPAPGARPPRRSRGRRPARGGCRGGG